MKKALGVALLLLTSSTFAQQSDEVFQGLGGKDGIHKLVTDFLPIITSDERIKHQFDDADMKHLAKMLAEQFCAVSGGPCKYTGKDMRTIHADLGITNAQFNALAEDLQSAMDKQGIAPAIQNKLVARLAPMQHEIVTK